MNLFSQSMTEIFRLLPAEYILDLDLKQRDTLLEKGEYMLPGGDSEITEKCTISFDSPDYVFFNYYFTTGQNGFVTIELRKFLRNDGRILIVYSRVGGMLRAYDQQSIFIFEYKDSKLALNKQKLLPTDVPIKDFLKRGTPDSIARKIKSYVMTTYSLDPENPNAISYNLFQGTPLGDMEKYLLNDSMSFIWNGRSFTRKLVLERE